MLQLYKSQEEKGKKKSLEVATRNLLLSTLHIKSSSWFYGSNNVHPKNLQPKLPHMCCNTLLSYIYILSKYDYSLYNSLFSLFLLPFHLCLVFCLLLVLVVLGSG
ncbi:unnamed protein product, partial [Vitis vinifera]